MNSTATSTDKIKRVGTAHNALTVCFIESLEDGIRAPNCDVLLNNACWSAEPIPGCKILRTECNDGLGTMVVPTVLPSKSTEGGCSLLFQVLPAIPDLLYSDYFGFTHKELYLVDNKNEMK
ncbi:hypothetical protein CEXT_11831 [Caerostris extrusa]|uniref:Uncharacterized protein n=1 Tax=Caerostris extrusa TaxID=172846 RepID=A0AAV4YB31_CAEEX|nr:hypothetical protein CEXT_11831 [Caerostris extrusa]